jgi:hypothetical protein
MPNGTAITASARGTDFSPGSYLVGLLARPGAPCACILGRADACCEDHTRRPHMTPTESFNTEEEAHAYAQQAGLSNYQVLAQPGPLSEMMPLGGQEGIPAIRFIIEYLD